ncbi:hypothetical protein niasHT_021431 [Heterodera trifolii]|uniref:Uncharacterized protein n=1 Tax=Heterodera trifolii TaxID=157864 RepID=A0ABD2K359_9BILA
MCAPPSPAGGILSRHRRHTQYKATDRNKGRSLLAVPVVLARVLLRSPPNSCVFVLCVNHRHRPQGDQCFSVIPFIFLDDRSPAAPEQKETQPPRIGVLLATPHPSRPPVSSSSSAAHIIIIIIINRSTDKYRHGREKEEGGERRREEVQTMDNATEE